MTVMEFINAHREDMDPCECVILPATAFSYQKAGGNLRRR